MLDGFKEMLRKICEGPYDNEIKPNMRLLYLTRIKVEKFAKHMDAKLPSDYSTVYSQCRLIQLKITIFGRIRRVK